MADGSDALAQAYCRPGHLTRLTPDEVALFHQGDHALFRKIVEAHSPRLLAFIRPFAVDSDDAHDLLQDMWHRAFQKRHTFSGTGTLIGWLYSICRNVGLGSARKRASRNRLGNIRPAVAEPARPDTLFEHDELRQTLHRAVMHLPDRERDVVVLRLIEGLSTRETAEALRCAEGTVKAALHHALGKLQSSMEVWVT